MLHEVCDQEFLLAWTYSRMNLFNYKYRDHYWSLPSNRFMRGCVSSHEIDCILYCLNVNYCVHKISPLNLVLRLSNQFQCLVFQDRCFVMCREVFPQSVSLAWMLRSALGGFYVKQGKVNCWGRPSLIRRGCELSVRAKWTLASRDTMQNIQHILQSSV